MPKRDKSESPVGYKKPPQHTQFKPGKSGNPKGRPKKATTFADVFLENLPKRVSITIQGREQTVSMREAIALMHLAKAAKGDPKSTQLVMAVLKPTENDRNDNLPELLNQFRARHDSIEAAERPEPLSADNHEKEKK
jgi:hypothetical protein